MGLAWLQERSTDGFQVGLSGHNQAMHQAGPELMQWELRTVAGAFMCALILMHCGSYPLFTQVLCT
jgi:hypothetical protein